MQIIIPNYKDSQMAKFSHFLVLVFVCIFAASCIKSVKTKPNFIVILCDDTGYADLGCYGHPSIHTPQIDKLACEGQKWTNFYVASSLCTPSRVGLLTGRLPVRCGMGGGKQRVILPWSAGGMPGSEITIAENLKDAGYATACIGKWHIGHSKEEYLPNQQGFDYFLGLYMNIDHYGANGWNWKDYVTYKDSLFKPEYYDVPLVENGRVIEQPFNFTLLTKRYVNESLKFIRKNKYKPFFLFLSHSMPHVPLGTSGSFKGISNQGLYGDAMEEIDAGVGEIMQTLKQEGLDKNTIVVFTSDNGPWLMWGEFGGSAGMLKGGKEDIYEGGFRVPFIIWGPDIVKKGVVQDLGNLMDLYPTFGNMAGAKLPKVHLDGEDITQTIRFGKENPEKIIYFYRFSTLYAVRKGAYKAYFREYKGDSKTNEPQFIHDLDNPELYNVNHDPSEKSDVAEKFSRVVNELKTIFEAHERSVVSVENQLDKIDLKIWEDRKNLYK